MARTGGLSRYPGYIGIYGSATSDDVHQNDRIAAAAEQPIAMSPLALCSGNPLKDATAAAQMALFGAAGMIPNARADRSKRSLVYDHTEHYKLLVDDNGVEFQLRSCKYCDSVFTFRGSTTSSALRHMKRQHPLEFYDGEPPPPPPSPPTPSPQATPQATPSPTPTPQATPSLSPMPTQQAPPSPTPTPQAPPTSTPTQAPPSQAPPPLAQAPPPQTPPPQVPPLRAIAQVASAPVAVAVEPIVAVPQTATASNDHRGLDHGAPIATATTARAAEEPSEQIPTQPRQVIPRLPVTSKRKRYDGDSDNGNDNNKPSPRHYSQAPTNLTVNQLAISHFFEHFKHLMRPTQRLAFAKHLANNDREAAMFNVLDDETRLEYIKEFTCQSETPAIH